MKKQKTFLTNYTKYSKATETKNIATTTPKMKDTVKNIPFVVPFGRNVVPPQISGNDPRDILGGKGTGLLTMSLLGINVPPGFTITTRMCQIYEKTHDVPPDVWKAIVKNVKRLELEMGRKFGDASNPLLLSSRSGAKYSMPGMLDTVLNVGLNSSNVVGLAEATNNPRFAYDCYRRLLDMYGDVVLGINHSAFEEKLLDLKRIAGVKNDVDLGENDLKKLCREYEIIYEEYGLVFPKDPYEQLRECVKAVFGSWNTPRAVTYREVNGIHDLLGTAVNIQAVVFGNRGSTSGTGVAFSRNPSTGEKELYGEYLVNAQGEDVVAGIRTPEPINRLKYDLPEAYDEFVRNIKILEDHFKDMQDVEFTIEEGTLWMLQCRNGKRTGRAAVTIAHDLSAEGICTPEEALLKIEPDHVGQLMHPTFIPSELEQAESNWFLAKGLQGGPGAAVGKIVFTASRAEEMAKDNVDVILVRENTSPEDVGGMWAAKGILTSRGGVTSHAAVVARGWGKPCVCGCADLDVDEEKKVLTVKSTGEMFREGEFLSLDGSTGKVFNGTIAVQDAKMDDHLSTVLGWADDFSKLSVLANADAPCDASIAANFGAKGIGLCRTEHMFFSPERLPFVRKWILSSMEEKEKDKNMNELRKFQRSDFAGLFEALGEQPVTIRLLDPPLHEFLPKPRDVTDALAHELGFEGEDLVDKIEELQEENPMLGLRGCRLGIVRPEMTEMQVEAIMEAAYDVYEKTKVKPFPKIMVPLVGNIKEYMDQALMIKKICRRVEKERGKEDIIPYQVGTMIEIPRAALISNKISKILDPEDGTPLCQFFSYGTNDLTQMTMGISRDDSNEFIPQYLKKGIYETDPFKTIDKEGVGALVEMSAKDGRLGNKKLGLSVCGEHGGDPESIAFFHTLGLDYVSCSPFRVPVARLAAGQAVAKEKVKGRGKPDDIVKKHARKWTSRVFGNTVRKQAIAHTA